MTYDIVFYVDYDGKRKIGHVPRKKSKDKPKGGGR